MQKITPTWHAPVNVHALTTTRHGGVSGAPFDSFNLGDHVGDSKNSVKTNRALLVEQYALPQSPLFLTQTHSTHVIRLPFEGEQVEADVVYTNHPSQVCLVMTADCLPVLFCNRQGNEVAAAHAGWRGLCDGILEATVAQFACSPKDILAWLGPAIGRDAFQVGGEVAEQFIAQDSLAEQAFRPDPNACGKYFGDLYRLARLRLNRLGITQISGGGYCTFRDSDNFFSYRRDNVTGRMASLVWFE